MIPHAYVDASDNLAQYMADLIDRQEVTVDWYLDHMIDAAVFRWTSDDDAQLGLDPWRYHADLPIEPEDVKARGWRLFVQRRDMPEDLRTVAHDPFPRAEVDARLQSLLSSNDARSDAELQDAADQRWNTQ